MNPWFDWLSDKIQSLAKIDYPSLILVTYHEDCWRTLQAQMDNSIDEFERTYPSVSDLEKFTFRIADFLCVNLNLGELREDQIILSSTQLLAVLSAHAKWLSTNNPANNLLNIPSELIDSIQVDPKPVPDLLIIPDESHNLLTYPEEREIFTLIRSFTKTVILFSPKFSEIPPYMFSMLTFLITIKPDGNQYAAELRVKLRDAEKVVFVHPELVDLVGPVFRYKQEPSSRILVNLSNYSLPVVYVNARKQQQALRILRAQERITRMTKR